MVRLVSGLAAFLGRLCLSVIFLLSGIGKIFSWSETAQLMRGEGMVAVPLFLVLAILFEICGGLSVLLGYRARLGALALVVFLVPVTLIFHDFWQYSGSAATQQTINFLKNVAIIGGLLLIIAHGAGAASLDWLRQRRQQGRQP